MATAPSRACTGTTRKGAPCKANPLKDRDTCLAHSDATTRESVGFVAANGFAGRKPIPKATEVGRRLVEENIAAVQRPYWRILGYDVEITPDGPRVVQGEEGAGAKIYGVSAKDGAVFVSEHDDLGAMMTASEKLQDRAFGKPKQIAEVSGPDGAPIQTEGTIIPGAGYLDEDVQRTAARLLEQAALARARELGTGES